MFDAHPGLQRRRRRGPGSRDQQDAARVVRPGAGAGTTRRPSTWISTTPSRRRPTCTAAETVPATGEYLEMARKGEAGEVEVHDEQLTAVARRLEARMRPRAGDVGVALDLGETIAPEDVSATRTLTENKPGKKSDDDAFGDFFAFTGVAEAPEPDPTGTREVVLDFEGDLLPDSTTAEFKIELPKMAPSIDLDVGATGVHLPKLGEGAEGGTTAMLRPERRYRPSSPASATLPPCRRRALSIRRPAPCRRRASAGSAVPIGGSDPTVSRNQLDFNIGESDGDDGDRDSTLRVSPSELALPGGRGRRTRRSGHEARSRARLHRHGRPRRCTQHPRGSDRRGRRVAAPERSHAAAIDRLSAPRRGRDAAMPRIALGLEYDGTEFCGWQRQPAGRSVQGCLEEALTRVADHPVTVYCAGRTDAGVHAIGQVAHFDSTSERTLRGWQLGANGHLPSDASVMWARAVPDDFHARFSARRAPISTASSISPARTALHRTRACWVPRSLDTALMRSAAAHLLGRHDFSAFRAAECQAKTTVRTLHRLQVVREDAWITIEACADAFLHHMVRNIAGVLIRIGAGDAPPNGRARSSPVAIGVCGRDGAGERPLSRRVSLMTRSSRCRASTA